MSYSYSVQFSVCAGVWPIDIISLRMLSPLPLLLLLVAATSLAAPQKDPTEAKEEAKPEKVFIIVFGTA